MQDVNPLHDRRSIAVGRGRIIYAGRDASFLTPGYVLPGGLRTSDEKVAREWAARIDHHARTGQWKV